MELPGASRFRKLALFEKLEIAFCLVVEPTLIASEMQPGKLIALGMAALPAGRGQRSPASNTWRWLIR